MTPLRLHGPAEISGRRELHGNQAGRVWLSHRSPTESVGLPLGDLAEIPSRAHAEIDRGEPEGLPRLIIDLDAQEALTRRRFAFPRTPSASRRGSTGRSSGRELTQLEADQFPHRGCPVRC